MKKVIKLPLEKKRPPPQRRMHQRYPKFLIARCEVEGGRNIITVINLSQGGIGVFSEEPLETGAFLKITFVQEIKNAGSNPRRLDLTLPVKVVWCKKIEAGEHDDIPDTEDKVYRAGLQLRPLSGKVEKRYAALITDLARQGK